MTEPVPETTPKEGPPSGLPPRFGLVYCGLMTAMLLASLDQMIVATALPTIVGELHGVQHLAWVTTAYILAATIVMPVYGRLGDLIGRKTVLLTGITAFLVGSVVAGLAQNMTVLIVGRVVQGLGGGGLMITSQAVIADLVPPRDRAKYMAPLGAVFSLASVAGPLLGGWLTDGIGWRWAFWLNMPLGLFVLAACAVLRLPRRPGRVVVDFPGIALMAAAVTCTVLVATWGGTRYPWSDARILALAVGGLAAWTVFFLSQRRAEEPVIPLRLFRSRVFNYATLIGMIVIGIGMFAVVGYLPTYLQMVYGMSATASGLMLLPMVIGITAGAVVSGQRLSKTGRYKVYPLVGTFVVAVAALLMSTLDTGTPLVVVCGHLLLLGVGVGLMMQVLVLAIQNDFPPQDLGTATSANGFFREIGATLGTAVVGALFTHRLAGQLADRVPTEAAQIVGDTDAITPALVRSLPDGVQDAVVVAYQRALTPVFWYVVPLLAVALAFAFLLPEKPIASMPGAPADGVPDGPPPMDDDRPPAHRDRPDLEPEVPA
ncbi:MDR family MFS transporter [Streptomyces mutabilis]|uniref:MDR family MFS transporter n=1 Tax=Streptomyces mutabilis TaxID=67332 RepID=UPI0007C7DE8A|nr:MDR family MFS transporter [Streptomyces mutabilis]